MSRHLQFVNTHLIGTARADLNNDAPRNFDQFPAKPFLNCRNQEYCHV
jgi:hypothetical protein